MVSGFLSPSGTRDITYPKELLDEIEAALGPYEPFPTNLAWDVWRSKETMYQFLADLDRMLTSNFDIARLLMAKEARDLVVLHIWGTDILQHRFWTIMDPSHAAYKGDLGQEFEGPIKDYFRKIDDGIRDLWERMGEDTNLLVISDHGFGEVKRNFDLNAWLIQEGYLRFKKDLGSRIRFLLHKIGLAPGTFLKFAFKALSVLEPILKFRFPNPGKLAEGAWRPRTPLFLSLLDADWSETKAFAKIGIGQIVINTRGREPEGNVDPGDEYTALRDEIVRKLKALADPVTGEKIFDRVHTKDERASGPYVDEVADIFVPPSKSGYVARIPSNLIFSNKPITDTPIKETHRMEGILMAGGGPIRSAAEVEGARIDDIAPTTLHMLGCPVPEDMDGKVLSSIFTEEFNASQEVRYEEPAPEEEQQGAVSDGMNAEERAEVEKRLRDLGYID